MDLNRRVGDGGQLADSDRMVAEVVTYTFWRVVGAIGPGFSAGIGIANPGSPEMADGRAGDFSAGGIGKADQRFVFIQVAS